MSHDLLMLRGEEDGTFNLAVGEPVFLQQALSWATHPPNARPYNLRYPPFGGDEELIEAIRRTNPNTKKHIIITNGAKQALLAAFFAYKTNTHAPRSIITMDGPYWPSYPTLAALSGMVMDRQKNMPGAWDEWPRNVHVVTSPNNPDGTLGAGECDVWDAAYHHWVYGASCMPAHEVSVWSAAKMFGMSGIRVGMATTDNDELARLMREYVEKSTSGVATDSQDRLKMTLTSIEFSPSDTKASYLNARDTLRENGRIFGHYLTPFITEVYGVPNTNSRGMFAWFAASASHMDRALKTAKVRYIPGAACGVPEKKGISWYRLSMGHTNHYTEQALKALNSALNNL